MESRASTLEQPECSCGFSAGMCILMALAGLSAAAGLILDRGFELSPIAPWIGTSLQVAGMVFLLMERVIRMVYAPSKAAYLQQLWAEFLLIVAAVFLAASPALADWDDVLAAGATYVALSAGVAAAVCAFRAALRRAAELEGVAGLIVLMALGGAVLAFAGSGLLMLPECTTEAHKSDFYIDALFTSAAAVCNTGLTVTNVGRDFTPAGQAIILILIQLGGIGTLVLGSMAALMIQRSFSLRRESGREIGTPEDRFARVRRMVMFVLVGTVLAETIGAVLLYPMFANIQGEPGTKVSQVKAVWDSVFHSVSAFCNTGMSLYSNNLMQGVREGWSKPLRDYWQVIGVIGPLIVLGGLGYPVFEDLIVFVGRLARRIFGGGATALQQGRKGAAKVEPVRAAWPELSLHTRLVLWTTAMLIVLSPLGLLFLEPHDGDHASGSFGGAFKAAAERSEDWSRLSPPLRVRQAIFQTMAVRSSGYRTLECREFSNAGKLWMCGLMVIGGNPAGTAGGIKTVAFVLLLMSFWSGLRQRKDLELLDRIVPPELVQASSTLVKLYLAAVAALTLFLCVDMPSFSLVDVLFEACSAVGTCGADTGITRSLDVPGKAAVMAGMFLGRVGPVVMVLLMSRRLRQLECTLLQEPVALA